MRTTLDLDEDVLLAAKELAARSRRSAGKVISEVFRRGLHAVETPPATQRKRTNVAAGFEMFVGPKNDTKARALALSLVLQQVTY